MASEKISKGVVIAHPGRLLVAYQAALGLQEAGMLENFETGFYFKNGGFAKLLLAVFPQRVAARLLRQLRRRAHEGLAAQYVSSHPGAELLLILFSRLRPFRRWTEKAFQLRNEWFDRVVGRSVRRAKPLAVIAYDGSALETFRAARNAGTLCVLDQVVGHINTGLDILREERRLHPEFADSLPASFEEWAMRRCSAEALMADRILAASEYVRDSLIANGVRPSRIVLCPYGVDVNRFKPLEQKADRPFRILFVGQICQRKGIKYLLEAFRELALEGAELVLVGNAAGSGAGLKPYEGMYRHVSYVPYAELPALYQTADVFAYPSLHEGSALAIYEALACGLPVVTTHNSGSVVRDGVEGYIVPIRDVAALKEKLRLLYGDEKLRERMARQARLRAEAYTWDAYRQRLGVLMQGFIRESAS